VTLSTFSSGVGTASYSATYLGGGRLKIAASGPDGAVTQSADVEADMTRTHTMNFWPSEPEGPGARFGLSCDFDGRHVLGGAKPLELAACPLLSAGANLPVQQDEHVRPSCPELNLTLTCGGTTVGGIDEFGPAHLVVTFPSGKSGRHEPVLATGRRGAGDVVYLFYEDDRHIRIGFDHWAVGGKLSDPIAVDYGIPHEIWVTEGSLYPAIGDDALWGAVNPAERARLKSEVAVVVDGKLVLFEKRATFPSSNAMVTIARNRIGASTADPDFSGSLHYSERTGSVMPPGLKL
jgi:hypothetical protein